MTELSAPLQAAIAQAVSENPRGRPDDLMREIAAAVADEDTRRAIRDAWHRATLVHAASEAGADVDIGEAFDQIRRRIEGRTAGSST